MIARDLVNDSIPPLKTSDTGEKALKWMSELGLHHLPIVNNEQFLGLISEEDILNLSEPSEPLGNHKLSLSKPYVYEDWHIFEVLKIASKLKLSVIPVVDSQENYIGVITLQQLIEFFANISSIANPGGIIVLELNLTDYALSEIARIVEANDARVLCSYITSSPESTLLEVTLKVNQSDVKSIIATFERYGYKVKASFQEAEHFDLLKERFSSLMNYLNI